MKTQINTLLSGTKNQILNPNKDYSLYPKATSHSGHAGTNHDFATDVYNKVISENPSDIKISILGIDVELKADYSLSGKTCSYFGSITNEQLRNVFNITPKKKSHPSIQIHSATHIFVSNGGNNGAYICPSLVEIK